MSPNGIKNHMRPVIRSMACVQTREVKAGHEDRSRARGQKQGTRSEAGNEGMTNKHPLPLSVAGGGKPRVPPRAQLKKKAGTTGRGMKRVIHRERLAGVAADCVRHLVTCQ